MTSRPAPRSPGVSVVRNEAKRGPRSMAMDAGSSPGLTFATRSGDAVAGSAASSMSASKRTVSLVPSWTTVCGVAGAMSSVNRARLPSVSMRPTMRGARMSPTRISLDGFRSSTWPPRAGPRARPTKSTGTYHVRPSRTGAAGSEMSRPLSEARLWPGDSAIVSVPAVTVRPPAAVSSRTTTLKSRARSSSANISWPDMIRAASGRLPSRDSTVYGAALAGGCAAEALCRSAISNAAAAEQNRREDTTVHDTESSREPRAASRESRVVTTGAASIHHQDE